MPEYGFFDADSLQLGDDGRSLSFRPRVEPLAERLKSLYRFIDSSGYPFIFTTCCSGRMPQPDSLADVLHVPLESSETSWKASVPDYRRFYLAKKTYGDPKKNFNCRAFDMFADNQNAPVLLEALGVEHWVVFGNGFDLCVNSAAQGILRCGYKVTVLSDLRISSAGGTAESEEKTIAELIKQSAQISTLEEIISRLARK